MTTQTVEQWSFVSKPNGVYVYDKRGYVEDYYNMDEIPSWISQMYDEGWLEGQIDNWGGHKRGDGFDIWAGGLLWFIAPSNDRVTVTEDTRFIVSPDTGEVVALVCVDPVGVVCINDYPSSDYIVCPQVVRTNCGYPN